MWPLLLVAAVFYCVPQMVVAGEPLFPEHLDIEGIPFDSGKHFRLIKTGVAERRIFFVPIYQMAHYVTDLNAGADILESPGPKAVQLVFQRQIDGKRIQRNFIGIIQESVSSECWKRVESSAKAYADPFGEGVTHPGDTFIVAWLDDGTLVSHFNGHLLSVIHDPEFARALWSVWVGPNSVVDRSRLLQNVQSTPSLHR